MDVYEIVTSKILENLEKGTVPWRIPWKGGEMGRPRNFVSTKPYRGINPWLLQIASIQHGFSSPFWVTYKQAKELGGNVKQGEKSPSLVVFFKIAERRDNGAPVINEKTGETEQYALLRYTPVFNTDQCEGLKVPNLIPEGFTHDAIAAAEKIVSEYPNRPAINIRQSNKAFYSPSTDSIVVPEMTQFPNVAEYYSTLFHEMGHSTGHEARLNRDLKNFFGDHEYSKEELVAEFTAGFLCGVCGIENRTLENSSAYIEGWMKRLQDKQNKKWLVWAASQATRAADYIRGIKSTEETETARAA